MTTACIAIIIIVCILSFMCYRNGYKNVGLSIMPVNLVPAGHLVATGVIIKLMKAGGLLKEMAAAMSIVTAMDVAACVIGCVIIIGLSRPIFRRNATRRTYVTALFVFMSILTLALLVNYYNGF